ncbi:MAG: HD domain-containing protein [Tannerella sp.]|nr:HD domain-containing protein [Tannerella sp.]
MDPLEIISKYYSPETDVYRILVSHSRDVADKALMIARAHPEMQLDEQFIEEAAMVHDIGIYLCDAREIGCNGSYPYICHGYLGAELMCREGYPRHALVCERHTGTGITMEDIEQQQLPLPHRDMMPLTPEEKIVCLADKFFSKTKLGVEKSVNKVRQSLFRYGADNVQRFDEWHKLFLSD